ncbi:MATE family efflux transporter [Treponema sp. TIM-1]|uniref:MATE family efflux transporter n=1 Tax=Treponema sp. TIM-1 TaxID=2898417 RepID=UPI00397FAE70
MSKIQKDLTTGSVFKKMVLFALPFLATNIIQSLYNAADIFIVGNFSGPASMSGVSIGGQITMTLTFLVMGFTTGATVLIGQYMGANNNDGIKKTTATIITLLLFCGAGIAAVILIFKNPILRLIQTPPESYPESAAYLTVTAVGIVFIFGYNALSAILRGMGNSKQPFYFVSISCVTNIVLDLVFVAGFHLGAFGAAVATVISQALSVILCIRYLIRNKFQFDFKPSSFRLYKAELGLIIKIGLPSCIQSGFTSLSLLFVTTLINVVGGVSGSAGAASANQFGNFAFIPLMAISVAISTMTAQNIGAGKMDRAIRSCRIGTTFAAVLTWAFFVLAWVFPSHIISIFGDDPAVIQDGVSYLRAFSFSFLLLPIISCINGFFIGAGHTVIAMVTSILYSVLLRVPLSYLFGVYFGWGLFGVGLGSPGGHLGGLLIIAVYLISGKWKNVSIKAKASVEA